MMFEMARINDTKVEVLRTSLSSGLFNRKRLCKELSIPRNSMDRFVAGQSVLRDEYLQRLDKWFRSPLNA